MWIITSTGSSLKSEQHMILQKVSKTNTSSPQENINVLILSSTTLFPYYYSSSSDKIHSRSLICEDCYLQNETTTLRTMSCGSPLSCYQGTSTGKDRRKDLAFPINLGFSFQQGARLSTLCISLGQDRKHLHINPSPTPARSRRKLSCRGWAWKRQQATWPHHSKRRKGEEKKTLNLALQNFKP